MFRFRLQFRAMVGTIIRAVSAKLNRVAAIGPNDPPAQAYKNFGIGSIINWPTGNMYGERWISIGCDTMISAHVTLSAGMVPDQQMLTDPVVSIGDRCLIGRGSAIVGHYRIDIGDDVYTGMNVYVTDQNHGYEDIKKPIGVQDPHDDPVVIGSGSWIGSGAVILPGARIGEHCVVAANSVVRGEFQPNSVIAGVPAKVVRTHDGTKWIRP
ncbi:MAG TPA: sugar acetyltransferase [Acidimicrobiaceae bacterium]|jgi:serine acetyltransferase|nr:acyltransferase [Acidimicrobiales bacterium]HAA66197.1 sugar acetyltransferase [Acidimicrobiaceae bacterium]HAY66055.1 sugar acetyltransferase [Acidimicrobiaceae bacterium]HCK75059.1 sugar acetyltransferase [Acidimicrobiaceae bacterium]|tara:strand:- start:1732 stop:2364 length:633 start_codon:yes stop_codon:yes gene_type:complete